MTGETARHVSPVAPSAELERWQAGERALFSFSDRPIPRSFGLDREQIRPAGWQE